MLGKYIFVSWRPVHFHSNREQNLPIFQSQVRGKKEKSYSECDWENYHFYCFLHSKTGRWESHELTALHLAPWNVLWNHTAEGPEPGLPIPLTLAKPLKEEPSQVSKAQSKYLQFYFSKCGKINLLKWYKWLTSVLHMNCGRTFWM